MNREERAKRFEAVRLYPVTYQELSLGRSNLQVLEEILRGGVRIVQLRNKTASKSQLLEEALRFREVTQKNDALLIINDHLDIALQVGADGVHLGQEDLDLSTARQMAPDILLGASCHNMVEVFKAQEDGADYVNIGPLFSTQTKENVHPVGLSLVEEAQRAALRIPFTVMGGINRENLLEVLKTGARKIAVVSAVVSQPSVEQAVRELSRLMETFREGT